MGRLFTSSSKLGDNKKHILERISRLTGINKTKIRYYYDVYIKKKNSYKQVFKNRKLKHNEKNIILELMNNKIPIEIISIILNINIKTIRNFINSTTIN